MVFTMILVTACLFLNALALAPTVLAKPHGRHQQKHQARAALQGHHHHRRDTGPEPAVELDTEWDTVVVVETVIEVIGDHTTMFMKPTEVPSIPSVPGPACEPSPPPNVAPSPAEPPTAPPAPPPAAPPSPPPASPHPPPPAAHPVAPPAVNPPPPLPAPLPPAPAIHASPPPPAPPVAPPKAPVAPIVAPPAPPPASPPAAPPAQPPAAPPSKDVPPGGSNPQKNTDVAAVLGPGYKSGDLTYYTVGLGSCGLDDSGKDWTDNIVAMAADTMGPQSNGNPMCGKKIKIFNGANGNCSTGTVRDKCPGCKAGSIDVSQKLFQELGNLADGRIKISWNWDPS